MEQNFPLEILLWIGQPAEFSAPDTKPERGEDGGYAAIIIIQKIGRVRGLYVVSIPTPFFDTPQS